MIEGDTPPTTYLRTCSMCRGIQLENIALYLQLSMKIDQLQDLGLVIRILCASISSFGKWRQSCLSQCPGVRFNQVIYRKHSEQCLTHSKYCKCVSCYYYDGLTLWQTLF